MTSTPNHLPLKVLLFTDSDAFAGTERHILDLACALREQKVEVSVACPDPSVLGGHLKREGLPHIVIAKGRAWDRPAIHTLRNLLLSGTINLIHAHNGRTTLTAALAVRSAKCGRCVATHHFIEPHHAGHRGLKRFLSSAVHRWVNRRVQAHVAISQAVRDAALARGEMASDQIHLVPNGIGDPSLGSRRSPQEVRAELGIDPAAPLIVCAARLEAEKNVRGLIHAMRSVVRVIPSAICVIAGEGAERPALEQLCRQEGLDKCVKMPGFCADAPSLIQAADLFALPSAAEAFGLALVEAMALGIPVVAIRNGGPTEIVVEGQTGLLTPLSDAATLGNALIRLLSDPPLRARMGHLARQRFESHFTRDRMARDMVRVYQTAMTSGGR